MKSDGTIMDHWMSTLATLVIPTHFTLSRPMADRDSKQYSMYLIHYFTCDSASHVRKSSSLQS